MIITLKNSYGLLYENQRLGPATWPYFDLIFVHAGQIQLRLMGTEQIPINPGQAILIYPETAFKGYAITAKTKISVHHFAFDINTSFLPDILEPLVNEKSGFEIYRQGEEKLIEPLIEQAIKLTYEPLSKSNEDIRAMATTLL